jgi:hypothetical protein
MGSAFTVHLAIKIEPHSRFLVEADLRWQFLLSVQEWRVYYPRSKLKFIIEIVFFGGGGHLSK